VTLIHPGRGPIDNDVVVRIATERIVFVGELVEEGGRPPSRSPFPWSGRTRSVPSWSLTRT
jgi:hypothetical protein